MRYFLEHPGYLVIDVDMHLGGGQVFLKNHGIFCAQTTKRLRELEALGPSEEAWEVRKPAILALYADLNFPSFMIGASYGVDIKDFADYLDEVKRLYRAPHHKSFLRALVGKLEKQVEAALSNLESQSPRELAAEVYGSTFNESDLAEIALEKVRYQERLREWLKRLHEGL